MGSHSVGASTWRQPQPAHMRGRQTAQRQPFGSGAADVSFRTSVSTTRSDHSDSTADIENLLAQTGRHGGRSGSDNPPNSNPQWPSHMQGPRGSTAQGAPRGNSCLAKLCEFKFPDHFHVQHSLAGEQGRSSNLQESQWDSGDSMPPRHHYKK